MKLPVSLFLEPSDIQGDSSQLGGGPGYPTRILSSIPDYHILTILFLQRSPRMDRILKLNNEFKMTILVNRKLQTNLIKTTYRDGDT